MVILLHQSIKQGGNVSSIHLRPQIRCHRNPPLSIPSPLVCPLELGSPLTALGPCYRLTNTSSHSPPHPTQIRAIITKSRMYSRPKEKVVQGSGEPGTMTYVAVCPARIRGRQSVTAAQFFVYVVRPALDWVLHIPSSSGPQQTGHFLLPSKVVPCPSFLLLSGIPEI